MEGVSKLSEEDLENIKELKSEMENRMILRENIIEEEEED
jgi:hypothetical protein